MIKMPLIMLDQVLKGFMIKKCYDCLLPRIVILLLMNMNCPHCQNEYQVTFRRIPGFTKDIKSAYEIYYQTCPH